MLKHGVGFGEYGENLCKRFIERCVNFSPRCIEMAATAEMLLAKLLHGEIAFASHGYFHIVGFILTQKYGINHTWNAERHVDQPLGIAFGISEVATFVKRKSDYGATMLGKHMSACILAVAHNANASQGIGVEKAVV